MKWEAPTGDCSFIDVSLSNNELDPAFGAELCSDLVSAPCRVELICSDTSYEFIDLTENTTYFVQARARFTSPNGQNLTSGEGIEISTVTNLERPEGDKIIGATIIPVTGGLDQIQVSWDLPTSEKGWNNIFVWRSEASTESAARNAVISIANSTGPSDQFAYDAFSKNNDWANTQSQQTYDAVLGVHNCFLVRAAYSDGSYYSDSGNEHVLCAKPLFTPPDFQGISQVTYLPEKYSTNDPGYGWLQVDFMNTPSGTIDRYALFFSESQDISTFDFNNPLAKVNYGHLDCTVSCDLDINDNTILVRLPITTILAGNYLVRWETEGSSISDTNVKIAYFSGNEGPPLSDDTVKWLSVGATAEIGFDPAFVGGLSGLIVVRGNELLNGQVAGEIEQFPLGDSNVAECAGAPTSSCLWSHESLDKWEPRYYQLTAFDDASGQIRKSRVFGHARVPAGMVYIDKELWPDSTGFHYSSWERYSFAMDKYEVSLASGTLLNGGEYVNEGNGVLVSSPTGLPIPLSTQSLKKGCFNRSTTAGTIEFVEQLGDRTTPARTVHLQTGLEYVIGSYGTKLLGGVGNCNLNFRGTPVAPDATGDQDNSNCVSKYGVRNMFGNLWEGSDDILTGHNWKRFTEVGSPAHVETIAANTMQMRGDGSGSLSVWVKDFDIHTGFPKVGFRPGPWNDNTQSKLIHQWDGQLQLSGARTVKRGSIWLNRDKGLYGFDTVINPNSSATHTGGRCALSSPHPGLIRLKNDSDGSMARFKWRMYGNALGMKVRFALSKNLQSMSEWDGENAGSSLDDDLFAFDSYNVGCADSEYNSYFFELPSSGNETGGLGLQGRCGIDLSSLAPWEKRYVKMVAIHETSKTNGHFGATMYSGIHVVARVPDGMVFVSADDWPDPEKHSLAAMYGESYSQSFDFAIDKYLTSAVGSVVECTTNDFPCTTAGFDGYLASTGGSVATGMNWFGAKHGCDARTSVLASEDSRWVENETNDVSFYHSGRRVHLATGLEWTVASFETPDATGPQFCHIYELYWDPGESNQKQTGFNSQERCQSRYGARNMIGVTQEFTDMLLHNGNLVTFWNDLFGQGIPLNVSSEIQFRDGFIYTWDFDNGIPTTYGPDSSLSFYNGDSIKGWGGATGAKISEFGPKAAVLSRGGRRSSDYTSDTYVLEKKGRLRIDISGPTTSLSYGARCALKAP